MKYTVFFTYPLDPHSEEYLQAYYVHIDAQENYDGNPALDALEAFFNGAGDPDMIGHRREGAYVIAVIEGHVEDNLPLEREYGDAMINYEKWRVYRDKHKYRYVCPVCGRSDSISVDAVVSCRAHLEQFPDGTFDVEHTYGDTDWDDDAEMTCGHCKHVGPSKDFQRR